MFIGTKKIIFADLDGVFFKLVNHFGERGVSARTQDEIELIAGLEDILRKLVERNYVIVGITNQPDIARKKITHEFLEEKHRRLLKTYPQITEVFICAHTETDLCGCRKPKPGLLQQAGKKYEADFASSWMIGDSRSDIEAGHAMRTRTILVQTLWNSESTTPVLGYVTAVAKSAHGALSLILALEEGVSNKDDV
ncbi:hypothetical protein A3A38_00205 [Candidatus Kaiserbacteria bacterium RIFCSPLOWO2_01_FULL_53_17]|uniref:D,D-heptose 1,7-bisphosphate phosphatase n=1 Tax=Candidatus Kaiserbacteria bacterium RIFCSPLOWO2_01_FULL_53_17 TaxID=1798511 RepID=A0A1F6EG65_9BACT|nr:MAG: hypothetical protein A3A38_00205 [Candidatus Kaiserbacteria bacterium RIFCSPLOWO2_01_FULL_53_17]